MPPSLFHTSHKHLDSTSGLLGSSALLTLRFTKGSQLLGDTNWLKSGGPCGSQGPFRGDRHPLIPGLTRQIRKNQTSCFPHFRYTSASSRQLGITDFVCLLEEEAPRVNCSQSARTRWRNSVHFNFLSTYSLVKRGLVYRKQWKFLRFLKGKG